MEVLRSDHCFLCLSNLPAYEFGDDTGISVTPKKGRKRKKSEVFISKTNGNACRRKRYETLMKYFLHYCGKRNQEQQEQLVRRLLPALLMDMEEEEEQTNEKGVGNELVGSKLGTIPSSSQKMFPVCVKCEDLVSELMKLHLELEVIQLKLVDKLKTIKDLVVDCSVYGRNEDAKRQMRALEMTLKQNESLGNQTETASKDNCSFVRKKRAWFDAVLELQTTVFEKFDEMNDIPYVILKKCMQLPVITETVPVMEPGDDNYMDAVNQNETAAVAELEVKEEIENEEHLLLDSVFSLAEFGNEEQEDNPESQNIHEFEFNQEDKDEKSLIRPKRAIKKPNFYTDDLLSKKSSILIPPPLSKNDPDAPLPIVPLEKRRKRAKPGTKKSRRRRLRGDQLPPEKRVRKNYKKHPPHCLTKVGNTTSRILQCTTCNFTCITMAGFIQHLRTHETSEKLYECTEEDCEDKLFSGKQFYDVHVIQHTDPQYFWMCKPCQTFVPPPVFKKHMERHKLSQMFPCEYCYYCCESVADAISHARLHGKTTKKCLFCDDTFSTRIPWAKHMYEKHGCEDLLLECGYKNCKVKCFVESQLRQHRTRHGEVLKCTYCDRQFFCKKSWENHIRVQHEKQRIFKCRIEGCAESFNQKIDLDTHLVLQHGLPKFKCDICEVEYYSKEAFRNHTKRKHPDGDPFSCSTCGKLFPTRSEVRRHEMIHGPRSYVCGQCGYAATNPKRFKAHAETHGEKRFACDYCGKRFVTNTSLKDHVRIHTGERPYVCQYCPSAFNQRSALSNHVKRHEAKGEAFVKTKDILGE